MDLLVMAADLCRPRKSKEGLRMGQDRTGLNKSWDQKVQGIRNFNSPWT